MRAALSFGCYVLFTGAGIFAVAVIVHELRALPARWEALCRDMDALSAEWPR